MHLLDWAVLSAFLAFTVWDGLRRAGRLAGGEAYFLADRRASWAAVALSVMATQASAITLIGTTGQGWAEGTRFIQFYLAMPLALLVVARFFLPLYRRHGVRTPYEYLGYRFGGATRTAAALAFLALRGMSVGIVIYAPSLVLAKILQWPLDTTILLIGGVSVLYTAAGGLPAVIRTDVKQMLVMVLGLFLVLAFLLLRLAPVGLEGAYRLAVAAHRTTLLDMRWDPAEKYTLWSALLGGFFLFVAYFGADQSQVQRLLAARDLQAARRALMFNAGVKLPFQLLVLTCGVLLFVFYTLAARPALFEPATAQAARGTPLEEALRQAQRDLARVARTLAGRDDPAARAAYARLVTKVDRLREELHRRHGGRGDTNYVFLDFVLHELPRGLAGLLLAAILAAALSSIDSEIGALSSVLVLDILRHRGTGLLLPRLATLLLGTAATAFALLAGEMGSLVEAVNRVGSYLYGPLLGVFLLAPVRRVPGWGATAGLFAGIAAVAVAADLNLAFLYLNGIGVAATVGVGIATAAGQRVPPRRSSV